MELVNGCSIPVDQERVREDPALLTGQVDRAVDFVETQDPQRWNRMASSRHVNNMVAAFKTEMGDTNFLIINALRKLEEDREAAQRVAQEAAEQGA